MRIFLSAGEASGDAYGAALVAEIRKLQNLSPAEELREAIQAVEIDRNPSKHRPNAFDGYQIEDAWKLMKAVARAEKAVGRGLDIKEEGSLTEALDAVLLQPEDFIRHVVEEYDGPFEGMGGPRMTSQRVEMLADTSQFGAISIGHSLPLLPKGLTAYYRVKRRLAQGTPGLFIPIDFGAVNIRLARWAKQRGWRVMYFIPPGSWRRDRQGLDLPALTDRIVTPFSWSAEMLEGMGANVRWFGHPIKQLVGACTATSERNVLAVLPGSRKHEIGNNLPILAEALKNWPHEIEFALAPNADAEGIRAQWPRKDDTLTVGKTTDVLRRARAAVVCSGTATLEAALLRVPTVVVYQADDRMRREEKILTSIGLFRRPEFVALPNILLGRSAVPEMIDHVNPIDLRQKLDALWGDGPEREAQLTDFDELDTILGPPNAITKAAEWALDWQ